MKALVLFFMLIVATATFAAGPDGKTVSATTGGTAYLVQNPNTNTKTRLAYAVCATDGFTVSAWRYVSGAWVWVNFGSGIANPDTAHAEASFVLPIEGKFDLLFFTTDTATSDIDLLFYSE